VKKVLLLTVTMACQSTLDVTPEDEESATMSGELAVLEARRTAVRAVLAGEHRGTAAQLDAVVDGAGRMISAIGVFDIGLDAKSSWEIPHIEAAVAGYVAAHAGELGDAYAGASAPAALRVREVVAVDGKVHVAHIDQAVGGLRVWDSDLSAAFWSSGDLRAFHGPVRFVRADLRHPDAMELADVVAIADAGAASDFAPQDSNGFVRHVRVKDGAWIERGWSSSTGSVSWRLWLPGGDIRLDEPTRTIEQVYSHIEPFFDGVTGDCSVRHFDFPRDANGLTSTLASTSGSRIQTLTCGGDDWFGTCFWHLKRSPSGLAHRVGRIDDVNGAEQEVALSCASSTVPSFENTNGDAMREQSAFWVAHQMRGYNVQNTWGNAAPDRKDDKLEVHIDDDSVSGAFFEHNLVTTQIRANTAMSAKPDVMMHEYGHYVVHTYGDVSNRCVSSSDHGDALDETLADVFGMIMATDETQIRPSYGALEGFANGQAPSPHAAAADRLSIGTVNCSIDHHLIGRAFEQAIWEILFNRNCSTRACASTDGFATDGVRLWGTRTQEQVIERVAAALGSALQTLGQNITFQQVRAEFIARVREDTNEETAAAVGAVFAHHGMP
jgi:hypothetical protein